MTSTERLRQETGRRPARSLGEAQPALAAEWHPDRNVPLTPEDVGPGSERKVWWRCARDPVHEWEQQVVRRARYGAGCPVCAGRRPAPEATLAATHPELVREWDGARNGSLRPDAVTAGSERKVWWRCGRDPNHGWETRIVSRTRHDAGCPRCQDGSRRPPRRWEELSLSHPALAAQWHPERNGGLTPRGVSAGSHARAWWRCEDGHEWQTTVRARALLATGCPFCSGRRVTPERALSVTHPDLAAEWHPERNGALLPAGVSAGSERRVWWRCIRHGEEWEAAICARARGGGRCPVCVPRPASRFPAPDRRSGGAEHIGRALIVLVAALVAALPLLPRGAEAAPAARRAVVCARRCGRGSRRWGERHSSPTRRVRAGRVHGRRTVRPAEATRAARPGPRPRVRHPRPGRRATSGTPPGAT